MSPSGDVLTPGLVPTSIASITGTALGNPALGAMSDWTVTVATSSKTFALPTSRIAFATTTSQRLLDALRHYRTVFSMSRRPAGDRTHRSRRALPHPRHLGR